MEPRVHFYLERALSDSKLKQMRADPSQRKAIDSEVKTVKRQLWLHLTFLKNQRVKVYTGDRFTQEVWDKAKERLNPNKYKMGAYDFNRWLDSIEEQVLKEVVNRFRINKSEPATKESLRAMVKTILKASREVQPSEKGTVITDEIKAIIAKKQTKKEWSDGYIEIANAAVGHLKDLEAKRSSPLSPSENYIEVWNEFKTLLLEKGFLNQTANKYLKLFKQVLKILVKEATITVDIDFTELRSLKTTDSFHVALKDPELKTLEFFDYDLTHLNEARDIMLLQTLSGQRISDLPEIISQVNAGQMIHVMQKKTKKRVTVPQYTQLTKFINKMRERYPNGLPQFTEQTYNEYIKECAKLAGITRMHTYKELQGDQEKTVTLPRYKLISSHTCRRTFATIARKNGISDQAIMSVTGHTSHKQFLEYVRLDDDDVHEEFNIKMK
jgi:site-specific recombinase XerD